MTASISYERRRFQVWKYEVGHKQLLLRSTKALGTPTRIDVLFKNVGAVHLPMSFDGLSISEAAPGDLPALGLQLSPTAMIERRMFVVDGADFRGYVVAAPARTRTTGSTTIPVTFGSDDDRDGPASPMVCVAASATLRPRPSLKK
jgi:hypothetical protein